MNPLHNFTKILAFSSISNSLICQNMADFIYLSKWQMVDEYRKSGITYSKKNNKTYDGKQTYNVSTKLHTKQQTS